MKFKKYIDFPNEIISKCIKEENGLTYDSLGFLIHLKRIFINCKIVGDTNKIVSEKSGINIYSVKNYLPVLLENGLCCKDNGNIIIFSDDYLKKSFGNVSIINRISLDGCSTVKDYSGRLKLSLVQRKVSQINYAVYQKILSGEIIEDKDNDISDVYRCIGNRRLAEFLGCSNGDVSRLLIREENKGAVSVKHITLDLNDKSVSYHLNYKILPKIGGCKKVHFGSVLDIKCIHNYNVMDDKN